MLYCASTLNEDNVMDRLAAAHQQYEVENSFASEREEVDFTEAQRLYIAKRKAYHLVHPEDSDLDVLSMEGGQLLTFINTFPNDPLDAAIALWAAITKEADNLAEGDAAEADYDTIMDAL